MSQITKEDIASWRKIEGQVMKRRNNLIHAHENKGKKNIMKLSYWNEKAKKQLFAEAEGSSQPKTGSLNDGVPNKFNHFERGFKP